MKRRISSAIWIPVRFERALSLDRCRSVSQIVVRFMSVHMLYRHTYVKKNRFALFASEQTVSIRRVVERLERDRTGPVPRHPGVGAMIGGRSAFWDSFAKGAI
jgi:hypothetical protein